MKTAIWTAAMMLAATLPLACADHTVTRQTTITKESTGYNSRGTDAETNVITHSTTQQRMGLGEAPVRSSTTTTVERPDGSNSTVEEERRTVVTPEGTTTHKRTTTTTTVE